MAPKKSERIRQKSFKTKPSSVPLVIHDESSDSERTPSQSSNPSSTREVRSKMTKDSSKKSQTSDKPQEPVSEPTRQEQSGNVPSKEELTSPRKTSDKEKKPSLSKKGKEKVEVGQGTSSSLKRKSKSSRTTSEITPTTKSGFRRKTEVCACSYIDFNFFESNGFYISEFLGIVGCVSLCSVQQLVYGECVREFYENLRISAENVLESVVHRQNISISKQDIIKCFNMEEANDDLEIVNMPKNELFAAVNGNLEKDYGREAMVMDFELLPRILHKVIIECICPRKGSSTSMSIDHAQIIFAMIKKKKIDIPFRIIDQIWRNKDSMIFGNVLMKIFEFKKIQLPSSSSEPIKLKRIGKDVLHHMSIYVKDYLWYTNDGSHFIDERHRKREIPFSPSIKVLEAPSEVGEEAEEGKSKRRRIEEVGEGSGRSGFSDLDLESIKNLIKDTIKEEIVSVQNFQKEQFDQIREEFKKSLHGITSEIYTFRTIYDEFSDKARKDLNNNVIAFDRLVDQMKKVGESVTKWFDKLDNKSSQSTQAVKNLQGEIQMFIKEKFPDYKRPGIPIFDLDSSPSKASTSDPKKPF